MTTFGLKSRFLIGTWNVRTLSESSRVHQIRKEMSSYNIDILGLSEVRWLNCGATRISGHNFLYSGNASLRRNGVGILLSPRANRALLSYNTISDRIITARINSKFRKISIIQCYAPTECDSDEIKDVFYAQLEAATMAIPTGDIKICMGDLNAKVGSNNASLQTVMGTHGLGAVRNDNGDRLVDFCARNRMFIGGTKFPHKKIHKYTWESPDGRTRNQIDHILISKSFLGSLLDVKTRRGADIDSDHMLLVATIRQRPASVQRTEKSRIKFNLDRLQDPNIAKTYNDVLSEKLNNSPQGVTNSWEAIAGACKESATSVLGNVKRKTKPWISEATWKEIENRKRKRKSVVQAKSNAAKVRAKAEYKDAASSVRQMVRMDHEAFYNSIADKAELAANTGNLRRVYSAIKEMNGNNTRNTSIIMSPEGSALTSQEKQLDCWRQFFSTQDDTRNTIDDMHLDVPSTSRHNPSRDISTAPPTCPEIVEALKSLQNGKAAGPDSIPAELLRYGAQPIAQALAPLIKEAWVTNSMPMEWKKGVIITIPKKGDLKQCKNWRGITLLNAISKVLAMLILHRISPVMESKLRKEQAGFRPGRSCADHINTLRIIIEQTAEYNTHLYLLFVDFERAFDTVNRDVMWHILISKGVPEKIVLLIRELYRDAEYRVRFNGKESTQFTTTAGVRQGCVLSPTLFLILLDIVLEATNNDAPIGIRWNLNEYLGDLDYADDICFLSHRFEHIEAKLKHLAKNAMKVGLKINLKKTKLMRIGTVNRTPLLLNGQVIEDVDSFCYLGSKITKDGGSDVDIVDRINKARGAFFMLHKVWRSNNISLRTKLRIFECSVKSVLLYGCTTWSLTQCTTKKIQTFINRCLRQILRIFWPNNISNEDLLRCTRSNPIEAEIRKRKWTWIGHIFRRPPYEIARAALDWKPQGQRSRGRPRNTWIRCTKNELRLANISWEQARTVATDRTRWRLLVDALCST